MCSKPSTKSRRFRFQYSLRTLLLFVTLASVFMAWFGAKFRTACQQRDAAAAVRALGGFVVYDYEERATRSGTPEIDPGPAWVRKLLGIDYFADVVRAGCNPRYEGGSWPQPVPITDAWLDHFGRLARMEELDLGYTEVTDEGLAKLEGLTRLRKLGLDGTRVGAAGLRHVGKLVALEALYLNCTKFTGVGLRNLRGLTRLRELHLWDARVTDDGLKDIAELTHLEVLSLDRCEVTDGGLKHLSGLRQLRTLDIDQTQVTAAGIAKLRRALPKCEITFYESKSGDFPVQVMGDAQRGNN